MIFSVWISLGSSCQELFARLLESVGLCLSPNLGEIQLFFLNLKILILFLFFWDSDHTNVRSFVIVPQVPDVLGILRFFFSCWWWWSLCLFSLGVFLVPFLPVYCLDRVASIVLFSHSHILSSVICICTILAHPVSLKFQLFLSSKLEIQISMEMEFGSYLYLLFLC